MFSRRLYRDASPKSNNAAAAEARVAARRESQCDSSPHNQSDSDNSVNSPDDLETSIERNQWMSEGHFHFSYKFSSVHPINLKKANFSNLKRRLMKRKVGHRGQNNIYHQFRVRMVDFTPRQSRCSRTGPDITAARRPRWSWF